jgi:RNA polymerase sigma-70 factor (ECF subfamily)
MPGSGRSSRSDESLDDVELVRRVRGGDASSLEILYARFAALIFTLALRILGDPELAREALQDTFLRCWDGGHTYDPTRGRVAWWLMGIARNRAIDLLRSRPHQARLRERAWGGQRLEDVTEPDAADVIALRREIVNALGTLTPEQRRTIELAYYGGLTQTEIASELGQPLGTVKSRTRGALDRLRTALRPLMQTSGEAAPDGA